VHAEQIFCVFIEEWPKLYLHYFHCDIYWLALHRRTPSASLLLGPGTDARDRPPQGTRIAAHIPVPRSLRVTTTRSAGWGTLCGNLASKISYNSVEQVGHRGVEVRETSSTPGTPISAQFPDEVRFPLVGGVKKSGELRYLTMED
jgi:hypothetical protein